jgi:hypothetical protein
VAGRAVHRPPAAPPGARQPAVQCSQVHPSTARSCSAWARTREPRETRRAAGTTGTAVRSSRSPWPTPESASHRRTSPRSSAPSSRAMARSAAVTGAPLAEHAGCGPPDARARSGDDNRLSHISLLWPVLRRRYPPGSQGNRALARSRGWRGGAGRGRHGAAAGLRWGGGGSRCFPADREDTRDRTRGDGGRYRRVRHTDRCAGGRRHARLGQDNHGGGEQGLGWSYASAAAQTVITELLADVVAGSCAFDIAGTTEAMTRQVRTIGRPGVAATARSWPRPPGGGCRALPRG